MTDALIDNLKKQIDNPDIFDINIDASPIRDLLLMFASRIESIQNKMSNMSNERDSIDKNEISSLSYRINDLSKQFERQNSDFTAEVRELKQFFQFQIKDLRERVDKSSKTIPFEKQASNPVLPIEVLPPKPPTPLTVQAESIEDSQIIKKLQYNYDSLSSRIDSIFNMINTLKEETVNHIEIPKIDDVPQDNSIIDNKKNGNQTINVIDEMANKDFGGQEQLIEITRPNNINNDIPELNHNTPTESKPATPDPRIDQLLKQMESVFSDRKQDRDRVSNIAKTTNKIIAEIESQRKDIVQIKRETQNFAEEADRIYQRISESSFEADKKINIIQAQLAQLDNSLQESNKKFSESVSNVPTIASSSSGPALPDFNKVFNGMSDKFSDQISSIDTNVRQQIHYLKLEMSSLKSMMHNSTLNTVTPNGGDDSNSNAPKTQTENIKNEPQQTENQKQTGQLINNTTPTSNNNIPLSSQFTFYTPPTVKDIGCNVDTEILQPIPIVRMSFGTPLVSIPNQIITHYIADRPPEKRTSFIRNARTNPHSRTISRHNSSKQITIGTNTPPFLSDDEDDPGNIPLDQGFVQIEDPTQPDPMPGKNSSRDTNEPDSHQNTPHQENTPHNTSTKVSTPKDPSRPETGEGKTTISTHSTEIKIPPTNTFDFEEDMDPFPQNIQLDNQESQTDVSVRFSKATTPISGKRNRNSNKDYSDQATTPLSNMSSPKNHVEIDPNSQIAHNTNSLDKNQNRTQSLMNFKKLSNDQNDKSNSQQYDFMEQYDTGMSNNPLPKVNSNIVRQAPLVLSLERMLTLTIISEVKITPIEQKIVVEAPKDSNGPTSQFDIESLVKQISQLTDKQKFSELENSIGNNSQSIKLIHSIVDDIQRDFPTKLDKLSSSIRTELSNLISQQINTKYQGQQSLILITNASIPPQVSKISNKELELNKQKALPIAPQIPIKPNMFVFTHSNMIQSPPNNPLLLRLKDATFTHIVNATIRPVFIPQTTQNPTEVTSVTTDDIRQIQFSISSLQHNMLELDEQIREIKERPRSSSHIRRRGDSPNSDLKNSPPHTPPSNTRSQSVPQTLFDKPVEQYHDSPITSTNRFTNSPLPNQNRESNNNQPTNIQFVNGTLPPSSNTIICQIQNCGALYVEAPPVSLSPRNEVETHNERILRDAIVELRTNFQVLKQRSEEHFRHPIPSSSLPNNIDGVVDNKSRDLEEMIVALRKKTDMKINDFENEFREFRKEIYQYLKDRPERIIERITEVPVTKSDSIINTPKVTPSPQQNPTITADVDLKNRKGNKLIGDLDSPRMINIHPISVPKTNVSKPESPIIVDHSKNIQSRPTGPVHINRPIDSNVSNDNNQPGPSTNNNTQNDSTEQPNQEESNESPTKMTGHFVPQVVDEFSVYNALPPTDYTDKLAPLLMKIRAELQYNIDIAMKQSLKAEQIALNKVDKEYVDSFFRKIRHELSETNERVVRIQQSVPERVTKEELNDRLESMVQQLSKETSTPIGASSVRCLICGAKRKTIAGNNVDEPPINPGDPIMGRQGPPRGSLIVGSDKGVYKSRTTLGKYPSNSKNEEHEFSYLPKL